MYYDYMQSKKAFSTIELLIAMAIATLAMTAVLAVFAGDQNIVSDGDINAEALHKAQMTLEDAFALARQDYDAVATSSKTECSGALCYTNELTIPAAYTTQCSKSISSRVTWTGSYSRQLWVGATTTISDISEMIALGGDCDITPPTAWDDLDTAAAINLGGQGSNDIDVANSVVYITSDPSPVGTEDFLSYQFDSVTMTLTELDKINLSMGVNRVDIAGDYAYIANASTTSSVSNNELLVVDISDPSNLVQLGKATLGITPNCPTFCPGGAQSVKYYGGRVYVGTHRIGGAEFYIYNVSTPSNPTLIRSFEVNHNVNDIVVGGDYAYLATSNDSGEIMILNIADPGPITLAGSFNANNSGNDTEDALRLTVIGNRLYFGREDVSNSSERDYYILDVSNPAAPTVLGSYALTLNPNTDVAGILVKGGVGFVAIDDPNEGMQILDVSNPAAITQKSACSPFNFAENASGMDVWENFVFVSSVSNDEIRVFEDAGMCSP
jgi:hypothetical protein